MNQERKKEKKTKKQKTKKEKGIAETLVERSINRSNIRAKYQPLKEKLKTQNSWYIPEGFKGLMDNKHIASYMANDEDLKTNNLYLATKDGEEIDFEDQYIEIIDGLSFYRMGIGSYGSAYPKDYIDEALKVLKNPEFYYKKDYPLLIKADNYMFVVSPKYERDDDDDSNTAIIKINKYNQISKEFTKKELIDDKDAPHGFCKLGNIWNPTGSICPKDEKPDNEYEEIYYPGRRSFGQTGRIVKIKKENPDKPKRIKEKEKWYWEESNKPIGDSKSGSPISDNIVTPDLNNKKTEVHKEVRTVESGPSNDEKNWESWNWYNVKKLIAEFIDKYRKLLNVFLGFNYAKPVEPQIIKIRKLIEKNIEEYEKRLK